MVKKTAEEKAKAKAERQARKAAKQRARDLKAGRETVEEVVEEADDAATKAEDHVEDVTDHIAVTGVLSSRADSRDAHITGFSVILFGRELIMDTELKINYGRRYGLIGSNGSGKSTLLKVIANRMIPIPEPIDMKLLTHEAAPSQQTAMEAVMAVVLDEALALEAKMEALMEEDPSNPEVEFICQRLDLLDTATVEKRTGELLFGLGFTEEMMHKKTCDMSGGWRMRVALSQVLLVQPTLLLLDEPTNHLDLGACVWLEDYLSTYPNTLIVVSHSQDFLNSVCTNIMELDMDSKVSASRLTTVTKITTFHARILLTQYNICIFDLLPPLTYLFISPVTRFSQARRVGRQLRHDGEHEEREARQRHEEVQQGAG